MTTRTYRPASPADAYDNAYARATAKYLKVCNRLTGVDLMIAETAYLDALDRAAQTFDRSRTR